MNNIIDLLENVNKTAKERFSLVVLSICENYPQILENVKLFARSSQFV